jgi:hypothetical protein
MRAFTSPPITIQHLNKESRHTRRPTCVFRVWWQHHYFPWWRSLSSTKPPMPSIFNFQFSHNTAYHQRRRRRKRRATSLYFLVVSFGDCDCRLFLWLFVSFILFVVRRKNLAKLALLGWMVEWCTWRSKFCRSRIRCFPWAGQIWRSAERLQLQCFA